jgi:hypothetical protein
LCQDQSVQRELHGMAVTMDSFSRFTSFGFWYVFFIEILPLHNGLVRLLLDKGRCQADAKMPKGDAVQTSEVLMVGG